jgi:alpha-tubulin suppressor-like RCC1 family protein
MKARALYSPISTFTIAVIIEILSSTFSSLNAASTGKVIAWGNNGSGQTNAPADSSNVLAIAAGNFHTLALKQDGMVMAWGMNNYGQSTVPAGLSNVVAIAAGDLHSVALK